MMVAGDDEPDRQGQSWNSEQQDLSFLVDEGLELLALYKSITDKEKRRLIIDLIRTLADQRK